MPDRRGSRFVFEALFLVGLAVAVTLAKLDALEIAGVMLLGWVVVAILEWAAWRGEPHYGSGLPPRYYVPNVNLPPAQPLEQVRVGYPEAHRDEAPTWIASAALREEVLGEWPHATPLPAELPAEPDGEQSGPDAEPWAPVALPAVLDEPRPRTGPGGDRCPAAAVVPARDPSRCRRRSGRLCPGRGLARYSLDPLGDAPSRRRFGRGGTDAAQGVDVPARPEDHARFRAEQIGRSSAEPARMRAISRCAKSRSPGWPCSRPPSRSPRGQTRNQHNTSPQPVGSFVALAGSAGPAVFGRTTACGVVLQEDTEGIAQPTLPCGVRLFITFDGPPCSHRSSTVGPTSPAASST